MKSYDLKGTLGILAFYFVSNIIYKVLLSINIFHGFVYSSVFMYSLSFYLFSALSYLAAYCGVVFVLNKGKMKNAGKAGILFFGFALVEFAVSALFKITLPSFLNIFVNLLIAYRCMGTSSSIKSDLSSFNSNKKQKQTIYRKEKFYTDDSPFARIVLYAFLMTWGMGIACLWGSFIVRPRSQAPAFFMIGFACTAVALLWTSEKIREHKINQYQLIVLPEHWPSDCSYEGYAQGLNTKSSAKQNGIELRLYEKCADAGISDLSKEADQQKALLIAQNMRIKDVTLEKVRSMFETGENMAFSNSISNQEAAAQNSLNSSRINELKSLAEAMRYYGPHGRDKRTAMLNDLRSEAIKNKKNAELMQHHVQNTLIQKEHDWAVHGGIASVAGVGASIATVADIQAKNAQIRAQNQANMPYVAMMTSHYGKNAEGYQAQADHYAHEIALTKDKLVKDDNMQEIFHHLVITDVKTTVSSTGAVKVSAKFKKSESYRIYETINPAIDGTVAARLYQNGVCAGSAYFVLPVDGITTEVELTSISTKPSTPNAKYEVRFEPVDVWAIERM